MDLLVTMETESLRGEVDGERRERLEMKGRVQTEGSLVVSSQRFWILLVPLRE